MPKSEGEGKARSGDYKSSVTKDEEHDSAAYEKSKYTKYGSDKEGGSTNDGDKYSVMKDMYRTQQITTKNLKIVTPEIQ